MQKQYRLPVLPYGYKDLEPYISEKQLTLHYQKHHQVYIDGANTLLEKLTKSREEGTELDLKAILKSLSFNIGGVVLHNLFWENLASAGKGGGEPNGKIMDLIKMEFGSLDQFKKEFSSAAATVEGSGWVALVYDAVLGKPLIMQIEKHNTNFYPQVNILLVLDVWEHAYYLDYQNDRKKFIEAFWNIINWKAVESRMV